MAALGNFSEACFEDSLVTAFEYLFVAFWEDSFVACFGFLIEAFSLYLLWLLLCVRSYFFSSICLLLSSSLYLCFVSGIRLWLVPCSYF